MIGTAGPTVGIISQPPPVPTNCDEACYKADRDGFVAQLTARRDRNAGKQGPNERGFDHWSFSGIAIGVLGALGGVLLPHGGDQKHVATATSAISGGITAWLATKKYETKASKYESCVTAADASLETFKAVYSDALLPHTDEEKSAYATTKVQMVEQLNKVCPE